MDTTQILEGLLSSLNETSLGAMSWWNSAELYQYAEDANQRLGRECPIYAVVYTVPVTAAVATYGLPARFVRMVLVDEDGLDLIQTNLFALEAMDPLWKVTAYVTAERYCLDSDGPQTIRVYPIPQIGGKTLRLIFQAMPQEITPMGSVVDLPAALAEFFHWSVLGKARSREGRAAMPEVAGVAQQMAGLFEAAAKDVWGAYGV